MREGFPSSASFSLNLQVNICSDVSECGAGNAGCELEDGVPLSQVGAERSLQYSTSGLLTLTYKGQLDKPTGTSADTRSSAAAAPALLMVLSFFSPPAKRDTFTINFVCDPNSHPGSMKLVREEMSTLPNHTVHDVLFEFYTALACIPSPVDCQITGAGSRFCSPLSAQGCQLLTP